jgi:hypothetical protein
MNERSQLNTYHNLDPRLVTTYKIISPRQNKCERNLLFVYGIIQGDLGDQYAIQPGVNTGAYEYSTDAGGQSYQHTTLPLVLLLTLYRVQTLLNDQGNANQSRLCGGTGGKDMESRGCFKY